MPDSTEPEGKTPIEPPNGMYPARVDDKGRLKLPVGFQEYFGSLPEKKLFVTSLDRHIGQIYPIANWRANRDFFSKYRDNPKVAQNVAFNANDLGADSEMDAQGRILLPPELRRELGIENQPVRIFAYKGRVQIYSDAVYQKKKLQAAESSETDVETLEGAGFQ